MSTETIAAPDPAAQTVADYVDAVITHAERNSQWFQDHVKAVVKDRAAAPAAVAAEAAKPTGLRLGLERIGRPNGQPYYVRRLDDHDDVAVLRTARERSVNVLLYGPPGTGKSACVEAAFAVGTDGAGLHTVSVSGDTEVSDLVGGYVQLPGGDFHWVDGPLVKAMTEGSVLFLDEVGLADPKVLAVLYPLMDGRLELLVTANPERGVVHAREGFYVVAATNPNAPGVQLSEALMSRFALQFLYETDYGLARKLGVPTKACTAAQNLNKKRITGEVGWSPQMRELLAFRDTEKVFGERFAWRALVSAAPEMDRPVVVDVVTRTLGEPVTELKVD